MYFYLTMMAYIFHLIITLRFDLNNDLSISINTDFDMCVEKDIFFSGIILYRIQNTKTYPSSLLFDLI